MHKDGWPAESDRNMFARYCLDLPLLEPGFIWILLQAFSTEHNYFSRIEILDITESLVMKAGLQGVRIELSRLDLIDYFFRLVEYVYPDTCILPTGYVTLKCKHLVFNLANYCNSLITGFVVYSFTPPKLTVTKSYWRVWVVLCVIAAFNPTTIGKVGWDTLPTLKAFMEMCMTK